MAWLSLDEGDNDPVRFWRHAAAALDRVRPGIAERVAPLLGPPKAPSLEGVVTALINELARDRGLEGGDALSYPREREHLVLARLLVAEQRADRALALLERLHAAAAGQQRTGSVIEVRVVQALALAASGEEAGALDAWTRRWHWPGARAISGTWAGPGPRRCKAQHDSAPHMTPAGQEQDGPSARQEELVSPTLLRPVSPRVPGARAPR